jgi:hypothetical protein
VCQIHFNQPKILPCGHVMCAGCIASRLQSKADAGCPTCGSPVLEGQGDAARTQQGLKDAIDQLPTDLVLAALVEATSLLDADHHCCLCDAKASHLCVDCETASGPSARRYTPVNLR